MRRPVNHQHHEPHRALDDAPPPRRQTPGSGWVTRGLWTLAACLLSVGGLLTLRDADPRDLPQLPSAVASVAQDEPRPVEYFSKPIREIQPIVDRVLADNPETDGQAESDLGPIQAAQWRLLSLRMAEGDGGELRATIARPVWWIESVLAEHSGRVPLESGELGIAGFAEVLETRPCPQARSGQSRLVTGVYEHTRADVVDVHVTGEPAPLGTTANHPFWSEDRQSFVPAHDLRPGEQVRLADGRLTPVEKVGSHRRTEPVYNLEVDGEHVYYVGLNGVLVHNANGPCLTASGGIHRGFEDINAFRRRHDLPAFDPLDPTTGTVARIYVNGKKFFGQNGGAASIPVEIRKSFAVAAESNSKLRALHHAEAISLMEASGEIMASGAKTVTIFVDRIPCPACLRDGTLKAIKSFLNLDELALVDSLGGINVF